MKKIRFDGGAINNPGEMGIGVVFIDAGGTLHEIQEAIGMGTSNIAEYSALLKGISTALEYGWEEVEIEGDSKLVINQMKGEWNVNNLKLKQLHAQAKSEASNFKKVSFRWIPREENSRADELVAEALKQIQGSNRDTVSKKPLTQKEEIDTKCPKCDKECNFIWQEFKNGELHLRKECPSHGFIRYSPQVEPYITLANSNKSKLQKKLF